MKTNLGMKFLCELFLARLLTPCLWDALLREAEALVYFRQSFRAAWCFLCSLRLRLTWLLPSAPPQRRLQHLPPSACDPPTRYLLSPYPVIFLASWDLLVTVRLDLIIRAISYRRMHDNHLSLLDNKAQAFSKCWEFSVVCVTIETFLHPVYKICLFIYVLFYF